MSRPYKFSLRILDDLGSASLYSDLDDALTEECFTDIVWNLKSKRDTAHFSAEGEYSLGGGRSEEEEIKRLREIIWEIVGRDVSVLIRVVYLEPDFNISTGGDYNKWVEAGGKPRKRCPCGTLLDDEDEWDGVCWKCEDKCRGCGTPLHRPTVKSTDETHCEECKVEAAALRKEDR